MTRPILNQRRALLIVVIGAVVASQLPAGWSHSLTHRPRQLVQFPLTPFTDLLHKLSASIRGSQPRSIEVENLSQRYIDAIALNQQLLEKLADAREQIAQLAQIRRHGSLTGVRLETASVVSTGGPLTRSVVTINRGLNHDVRPGQPVAQGFNLVGRVTDSGALTSTVELITTQRTRLDVRFVPPDPNRTTLDTPRQLELMADRRRFFCIVGRDVPVQVGDLAHLSDKYWPTEARGLIVGSVQAVEPHPDNPTLEKRVIVEPLAPLRSLTRVVVFVPVE